MFNLAKSRPYNSPCHRKSTCGEQREPSTYYNKDYNNYNNYSIYICMYICINVYENVEIDPSCQDLLCTIATEVKKQRLSKCYTHEP